MNNSNNEIWKDIVGYEGLYQISNFGQIKSVDRYYKTGRGGMVFRKGNYIKPKIDKYGYYTLGLYKDGKQKFTTIHRLVALHFISNDSNLPQVNHIDENKLNNHVDNLEWCNAKYNSNYGNRNKKISSKQKNSIAKSKPITQQTKDGVFIKHYPSIKEAARCLNIGYSEISKCCMNKLKSAGGFMWKYASE